MPRAGGTFQIEPLLLSERTHLTFGPYYFWGKWVTVTWAPELGYEVHVVANANVT